MSVTSEKIKNRAYQFVKHWQGVRDKAQQTGGITERQNDREFIADLYEVFGISRNTYRAGFEYKQPGGKRIDSLLPGVLLVEMESQGVNLFNKANSGLQQARHYAYNLLDKDRPKYILTSDFNIFYLENPTNGEHWETSLDDFIKNIEMFNFLLGYEQHLQILQAQVNKKAAESISHVYRIVLGNGVAPNAASLLMTRLVFALFADDTEIFPTQGMFEDFIKNTREDGSDLLPQLILLFNILNTPTNNRLGSQEWPYINGGLFAIDIASVTINRGLQFDSDVRRAILQASEMDWSQISPVIFGSMFEGALDPEKRHDLGAHFTSENNILKVIDSLFMNELHDELRVIRMRKRGRMQALTSFHEKISALKFLDPASGSGNFLIVAYRELRRLEHEVLGLLIREDSNYVEGQVDAFFIEENIKVEVAQFYGIEIQPYAVSVARVGLWLMDHIMNMEASKLFGLYFARLPLHAGANIVQKDALKVDWFRVFDQPQGDVTFTPINANQLSYIFGNPPFIGSKGENSTSIEQKKSMQNIDEKNKNIKSLDFVAAWIIKASQLIESHQDIKAAFVSTNSIVQGEQAISLWPYIFRKNIELFFAHQTFNWDNNGAHVHVVITGIAYKGREIKKRIFSYKSLSDLPVARSVRHINEYLVGAPDVNLKKRNSSLSNLPHMEFGSIPYEYGQFLFTRSEKDSYVANWPETESFFHMWVGASEMLHSAQKSRYILYVKNMPLSFIKSHIDIIKRIQKVRENRLNSKAPSTHQAADRPMELISDKYVSKPKMVIPRVTSGKRDYITVGFYDELTIIGDAFQIYSADLALFAILSSSYHRLWLNYVGGKLKSDYRYSNTLVYNNFIVPKLEVEEVNQLKCLSQAILDIRENYLTQGSDLADLYNSTLMPTNLRKIHNKIDKVIDKIYGLDNPTNEGRVAILMELYQKKSTLLNEMNLKN